NTNALQSLSDEQKATLVNQLTSQVNLSLSLISLRLLSSTLGLPEVLPQVLSRTLTENKINNDLIADALDNLDISRDNISASIQTSLTTRGFTEKQAVFISDVGARVATEALLTPTPSIIHADQIRRDILEDSLAASVILHNQAADLEETR